MQRYIRLCLWQVMFISILSFQLPVFSAEEGGIRIRGPKSTDVFPYDKYGPITASDTLWKIALNVRPDPYLSVYQVMQGLYQANPQAFNDNNLNHLVEGQYLRIPDINEFRKINPSAAQKKSEQDDEVWAKKVVSKPKAAKVVAPPVDVVQKRRLRQSQI
jgi:pilus assembly protein FimV